MYQKCIFETPLNCVQLCIWWIIVSLSTSFFKFKLFCDAINSILFHTLWLASYFIQHLTYLWIPWEQNEQGEKKLSGQFYKLIIFRFRYTELQSERKISFWDGNYIRFLKAGLQYADEFSFVISVLRVFLLTSGGPVCMLVILNYPLLQDLNKESFFFFSYIVLDFLELNTSNHCIHFWPKSVFLVPMVQVCSLGWNQKGPRTHICVFYRPWLCLR